MTTATPPPAPPAPTPREALDAPAARPPLATHATPPPPRDPRPSSLASEAGLLLLSLVLAVMVWFLVRELANVPSTIPVTVQPVAPKGWLAAVSSGVTVSLHGPRGEVEEALSRLGERNNTVRLVLADLGGNERVLGAQDRFQFPFHERLLDGLPQVPPGEMWRLEVDKPVRVLVPAVEGTPPAGVRVRVEVPPDPVRVTAPFRALGDTIEPDPIDVRPLLAASARPLGAPLRVPLTFERWRRGEGAQVVPPTILRRRAEVSIEGVEAVVRFEVTASANLAQALEVVVKRGYEVREISPTTGANAFTGARSVTPQNPRLEVTYTGRVTATADALKDLEEHRDEWRWVLWVSDADLPDQPQREAEVTAHLAFRALSDRLQALVTAGTITFEPLSVPVLVGTR